MSAPYLICRKFDQTGAFFPLCFSYDEAEAIKVCAEINGKVTLGRAVVIRTPEVASFIFGKFQIERVWP